MSRTPGSFGSDDSAAARFRAVLRALLAFVVFPNLLFLLIGLFLFTNRAFINIDYALLGALWLMLPQWLGIALFALAFLLDAVGSTAAMYNVHIFAGLLALMRAPAGLIGFVAIGLALALAGAVGIGYFAHRFLRDRRRRTVVFGSLAAVIVLVLVADVFAGGNRWLRFRHNPNANVATSSTLRFAWDLRDRVRSASVAAYPVAAASDPLRKDIEGGRMQASNVVVIIVESMGALRDSTLSRFVWAPLHSADIARRYELASGTVRFRGGTTSGELRELCGIFADYITLPTSVLPHCLPRLLHASGFTTYAVHGYRPNYYNRARWYPMLFDSVFFDASLARLTDGRRCGTQFRGVCDRDAFTRIQSIVRGGSHRMAYWMTIDAHTPVDIQRRPEFAEQWRQAGFDHLPACRAAPEVCLQGLCWHDMLERVAALALDTMVVPTRYLIVGDHAPAFVRRDRAVEFRPGLVPYIDMAPR